MNNWISAIFGRTRNPLKMLDRRRNNNRGVLWASLIGLGVGAAAFGISRNRNHYETNDINQPIQNALNNLRADNANRMPNMAHIAEFADEILAKDNKKNTNK